MSRDNSSDRFSKSLPILGDVTNQISRRRCSSILGNEHNNRGDGFYANLEIKDKEKGKGISSTKRPRTSPWPCIEINSLRGNIISGISKIPCETKHPDLSDNGPCPGSDSAVCQSAVAISDEKKDNCVGSISVPVSSYDRVSVNIGGKSENDEVRDSSEETKNDSFHEQLDVSRTDGDDHGVDSLLLSQTGSVDCLRFPESQESRSGVLEKCTRLKDDGSFNSAVNLIEACSCSFCMKAAYIWSDLHYQDIKGRIAVLKKSQREASTLVQRSCKKQGIERHGSGNSSVSKLESDLTGQWRSLFLHMEDIFVRESNQLEASLLTLTDLRENCKTDLELMNGTPLEEG